MDCVPILQRKTPLTKRLYCTCSGMWKRQVQPTNGFLQGWCSNTCGPRVSNAEESTQDRKRCSSTSIVRRELGSEAGPWRQTSLGGVWPSDGVRIDQQIMEGGSAAQVNRGYVARIIVGSGWVGEQRQFRKMLPWWHEGGQGKNLHAQEPQVHKGSTGIRLRGENPPWNWDWQRCARCDTVCLMTPHLNGRSMSNVKQLQLRQMHCLSPVWCFCDHLQMHCTVLRLSNYIAI